MRRYSWLVLSCLVILSVVACAPSSVSKVPATYKAAPLKGNLHITFNTSGDTLLIDITGPTVIGSAVIEKTAGQWPAKVVMRLHAEGLEKFKFQYGNNTIDLAVSSGGDHSVREVFTQPGKMGAVSSGDPYWIAVTSGEGYFDLEAPADFFVSGGNKFTIEWIDFYR